ncbi:hypothetical protein HKX48_001802 [Thoreauomyces humboldtii]|nr:hypothetical protein HKX48_001802 [Thoreauomyces humboldtii]
MYFKDFNYNLTKQDIKKMIKDLEDHEVLKAFPPAVRNPIIEESLKDIVTEFVDEYLEKACASPKKTPVRKKKAAV